MDNIPYFSIIVPAFKAEKTIKRCIDSVINQSYKDYELIIIDDGSTDNTYSICKEYESIARVHIISQPNQGISATRQLGLSLSTDRYIQFIDSDDWVDASYFEDMYELLKNNDYDVVILDYYAEKIKSSTYKSIGIKSFDREDLVKGLVTNIPGVLWNKLIKREVFNKYNIGFNSGLHYCEDWVVTYELFNIPLKFFYFQNAYYHYDLYSNANSLARIINDKTLKNRRAYIEYLEKLGVRKLYPEVFDTQYAAYVYIVVSSGILDSIQFKNLLPDLNLNNSYLQINKKIVLYIAEKFGMRIAYYMDYIIRKIFGK